MELFWKKRGEAKRGGLEKKDEKEVLDGANWRRGGGGGGRDVAMCLRSPST